MALRDVALAYYRFMRALTRRTQDAARQLWRELTLADLDGSWRPLADRMLVTVASGQLLAAQQADAYLDAAVGEQGADLAAFGRVAPSALAGVASDGRSLDDLLREPVIRVKTTIGSGARPAQALGSGEAAMLRIAGTQVQDAGRVATGVGIAARPAVTGWVRMLNPPSCGRCAVLAGRRYRWSDGFRRHPLCDCVHVPAVEDSADDLRTDPDRYFRSLSSEDQDRYFGVANARAIRDGADMGRVVNATGRASGTATAGGRKYTTDATTRRGTGRRARLTPESIYAEATDRDDAVRLLRVHGYIL